MNVKVLIAGVLLVGAVAVGLTSFRKTMTPYITFREARAMAGQVQVNGVLASKDYVLKADEQYLQFQLRDSNGDVLPVEYHGQIPGNFDQAESIVAIGEYRGDRFHASKLLVKCPSKYQEMNEESQAAGPGTAT